VETLYEQIKCIVLACIWGVSRNEMYTDISRVTII